MATVAYSTPTPLKGDTSNGVNSQAAEPKKTYSTAGDTPSRRSSTSPGNRSRSFSISDILSDELGSRKRHPTSTQEPEGNKQAKLEYGVVSPDSSAVNKVFPSSAMLSPITMYSTLHQQVKGLSEWPSTESRTTHASQVYPVTYQSSRPVHLMTSPTSVPHPTASFPPVPPLSASFPSYPTMTTSYSSHLAAAAQMQNYLHMQQMYQTQQLKQIMAAASSAAALQQLPGVTATSLQPDQAMGEMRLKQQDFQGNNNSENTMNENAHMLHHQVSTTPILLKNKRKTTKPSVPTSITSTPEGQYSRCQGYYPKPHYSRSPLKPPNTTFSPSIFLTRPTTSSVSVTPFNASSSPESTDGEREVMGSASENVFMTSTPIRRGGGDSASFVSLHSQSPISSGRNTSEYFSSGNSESEVPLLRRPRVPRKRTKPHSNSSYGPLMENTNSMSVSTTRHTPSHAPPSSLLTSYTAPPIATGGVQHNYSVNDSGFISDSTCNSHKASLQENMSISRSHPMNASIENVFKTPVKNLCSRQPQSNTKYPDAWGSSPFTDNLRRTGRIQSVPPWFVCSDKRRHGKRLRLTEAINKSLMDTPSQTAQHQLPAEWQKFAYGQTDDQKDLTKKARSFLKCRPRVLQFERTTACV